MGMRNRLGLVFAWLAIAIAATAVSSAAVSSVRSQVTDVPELLGAASFATPVAPPLTTPTSVAPITTEAPADPTVDSTFPTPTTTTPTTATTAPPGTPTTTVPPPTTTTTVFVSTTHTFDTDGGSIIVEVDGDDVSFVGAFPQSGWKVELEDSGPEEVEVHFEPNNEDDERKIEFKAWVEDGVLLHDISEES